jgi:hypothetical protein
MSNPYITYIRTKEQPEDKLGFFWSKEDRKPAGFVKQTAYKIGSLGISIGALYFIALPKGKALFAKTMRGGKL